MNKAVAMILATSLLSVAGPSFGQSAGSITQPGGGAIGQPGAGGAIGQPGAGGAIATGTMARVPEVEQPGSVGSTANPQNVVERKERQLNEDGTFTPPSARVLSPPFR